MKIRLSQLRRIIRETLEEEAWPAGRWYPGDGEPVSDEDVTGMDKAGLGLEDVDEADDETKNQ